ncbi:leptin receptor overlapping transcript-like 1 [Oppia nitens]|uniref:leptin receptor overlapping transcript-like 1 n=1 Tax=Oppia nitens TaxID=1686743 RepID=UPI0023DA4E63|nr:leptin receptor overlapping transcript-like 1 [Oppia nitens]
MTLVVLGCALPSYNSWWPFFVVIFYVLAPLPTIIARRYQDDVGSSNACKELALFLTAGIVISAYGLPIVLSRSPITPTSVIETGACILVLFGNTVVFLTILGFFIAFDKDDDGYNMW